MDVQVKSDSRWHKFSRRILICGFIASLEVRSRKSEVPRYAAARGTSDFLNSDFEPEDFYTFPCNAPLSK
ncbi:MAG: hypothetical protein WBM32_01140 [Crocosphaera sp.]